jgi:DNA polymerase III subunit beta
MTAHDPNAFDPLLLAALAVPADRLRAICRQLAPAFIRRSSIAVLETVLIEAGKTGTTFRLTDLDMQIAVTADDLTCPAPFRVCVPFGLLRRCAATFDGMIRISYTPATSGGKQPAHPDRLTLATDDGSSATINLLCGADDFPDWVNPGDGWTQTETTPAQLRRLFALSRPCISTEETRYHLNGVYLCQKPGGDTLRAVATDGHRMAVIDSQIHAALGDGAILPTRLIGAILTLVDQKANEPVTVMLAGQRARILTGQVQIDARLIDGTFPDYTKVLPKAEPTLQITITAAALRRLTPFATEWRRAVKFHEGWASIDSPELGTVRAPVMMMGLGEAPADMTTASPYGHAHRETWGFNLRYLMSQAGLTPTFRMDVASPSDPARVHGEDPDAMWVIMPMRV